MVTLSFLLKTHTEAELIRFNGLQSTDPGNKSDPAARWGVGGGSKRGQISRRAGPMGATHGPAVWSKNLIIWKIKELHVELVLSQQKAALLQPVPGINNIVS